MMPVLLRWGKQRADACFTRSARCLITLVLPTVLLGGCATDGGSPAESALLQPAGWKNIETSLEGDSFADYTSDVRRRLAEHRIPMDPDNASLELERAAPVQLDPVDACDGEIRGIAILVHGLSDTAYAMHDLAINFSKQCYIARTVLLPGHGTRPGDLLIVSHHDWTNTVRHLVNQAAREHEHIVLAGFSLGAIVTLDVALDENSPVDAVLAVSPAYHFSSWPQARYAPWVHRVYRWLDKGLPEDPLRYEAMPTRGVAELVRARSAMLKRLAAKGGYDRPWMLIQSLDDSTTLPLENQSYVLAHGNDARSRVLDFYSDQQRDDDRDKVRWLSGTSDKYQVQGLSHLAVHVAPENPHYGIHGDYRHCGVVDGRNPEEASRCVDATQVAFADWRRVRATSGTPMAISSFNPHFDELTAAMTAFLNEVRQ